MVVVGERLYCEAEKGESIENFAKELKALRDGIAMEIIAVFNDTVFEVNKFMSAERIIKLYYEKRKEL